MVKKAMIEYNNKKRPYKFNIHVWNDRTLYEGSIIIEAYDRNEAIQQFKETRVTLTSTPKEFFPVGKDCSFTCEPA